VEQAVPPLAYPCDNCRKLAPLDTEFLYYGEPTSVIPESEKGDNSSPNHPDNVASEENHQILEFRESGLMGELYEWLITFRGIEKPTAFTNTLEIAELIDSLNAKKIISTSNLHNIPTKTLMQIQEEHSSKENIQMNMFIAFMEYRSTNPIVITYRQQNDQGTSIPQTSYETANDSVKQLKRYPWRPMKSNHLVKQGRAKWVKWVKWALIIYGILAFYFLIVKGCEVENTDYCYYEDGKRECEEYIDYGDSYDYLLDYREY